MDLKTIRQVSQDYGISRQMLCYYEQIGLIKSSRKDDYAYRMYDEDAIKRLRQIIILRKLQIPVKQIKDILKNQDAVTVIEIFRQNISELDEKITAMSAVRSILKRFIDELQEKADVHLKLDLLNDKTMIAVMDSLSFPENKIEEKVSMEELNKTNEALNKIAEKNVRIGYLPPMTVASAGCDNPGPDNLEKCRLYINYVVEPHTKGAITMRDVLRKFIDDMDLFNIKPDARVFGFQNHNKVNIEGLWFDANAMWVSIPDDFDVPAPLEKIKFFGGLYAWCPSGFDLMQWINDSEDYEWAMEDGINRPIMEEFINPFNRFAIDNTYSETGFITDGFIPIRKTKRMTDAEKAKLKTDLAELEKLIPRNDPVEIDLMSMTLQNTNGAICELNYPNRYAELKTENSWSHVYILTPQQYNYPLKIKLRAKTDKSDLYIGCAQITVQLKFGGGSSLGIIDETNGGWTFHDHKKHGEIPVNEFVDIEFILGKKVIAVKINDELRHYSNKYGYMKEFSENPDFDLSSAVSVGTSNGSTVTVESLKITEISEKGE